MSSKPEEDSYSDNFDRLPDALLLFIFNKLQDAKSLSNCLLVSKRFFSLTPFTDTIFVSIPTPHHLSKPWTAASYINTLRLLVHSLFLKPLKCFHHITAPKSATRSFDSSHHQPNAVLKNFKEIKSLHLELPSHGDDLGSDCGASFLKWKAEFGSNLETCIILGATSFERSNKFSSSSFCFQQKDQECMEQTLTDDELKLRVIWTISCLIAASTRHYWFKKILADHPIPILQRLLISDANKQGKLYMGTEELVQLRNSMNSQKETLESSTLERTPVPELSMKLWYLPVLELPESGYVMRGATLVLIRPVAWTTERRNSDLTVGKLDLEGDGKAFSEAVREMIKVKKNYLMTMSSF
ncbi:F-box domain - like 10 [Theobroma cacao]|nr:F-box domain - like 10 [Theobroma cacao]